MAIFLLTEFIRIYPVSSILQQDISLKKNHYIHSFVDKSSRSWRHLHYLTSYPWSLLFYSFYLSFMIIYKNLLIKRSLVLILKVLLIISESCLLLFLLLSSFIPIYQFFHFLVKFILLSFTYYPTHLISSIFIQ
jgi:hypothetical protein